MSDGRNRRFGLGQPDRHDEHLRLGVDAARACADDAKQEKQ